MAKKKEPPKTFELFHKLKTQVLADIEFSNDWRVEAKGEFDFVAGPGQWSTADKQALHDAQRPVVTFNKTLKYVKALCGLEANNRRSIIFLPEDPSEGNEVKANELLTHASEWMDAQSDAQRQQARAFRDAVICGMGWTEEKISLDDDPAGMYEQTRVDPLEIVWDKEARSSNLTDRKRVARVRRMLLSDARDLIESLTDEPFDDEDLDASWAAQVSSSAEKLKTQEQKERREANLSTHSEKREVHLVQIQWWEYEPYYKTIDFETGEPKEATVKDFKAMQSAYAGLDEMLKVFGPKLPGERLRRKVYKQAFLGSKILMEGPCPRANGFTLNCITWEPDDTRGTWFGLVRPIRDPAVWDNKFRSQAMHIFNATAKGGIIAEADAFDDIQQAQMTYARPDAITVVREGAVSKSKIIPKPGQGNLQGISGFMEMANSAYSDVLGINLELMGLADREQAGVLEAQRKQAAMTILATLFDSLASYQKDVGRTRLYFIQNYLADDRFIRVTGSEGMKFVKLAKEGVSGKYDVRVDDAPTSPDAKEKAWGTLQTLIPMLQNFMTPKIAVFLLEWIPNIPSRFVEGIKKISAEPDPQAEKQAQIAERGAVAAISKDEATAQKTMAEASKVSGDMRKTEAETQLTLAKTVTEGFKAMTEQVKALTMKLDSVINAARPPKSNGAGASNVS